MTRLHTTDTDSLLPDDGTTGVLVGRAWDPAVGGPSVVAIRAEGVVDLSATLRHHARGDRDARPGGGGGRGIRSPARIAR